VQSENLQRQTGSILEEDPYRGDETKDESERELGVVSQRAH